MAGKFLKGLAIAAGTGLAIAFLESGKRRREIPVSPSPSGSNPAGDTPALEPLLDRLDRIETRMNDAGARPLAADGSVSLAEMDLRIQALQVQVSETRQRVAAEAAVIERRVEDLRARLLAEMRESLEASQATFERTIDSRISLRMSVLKRR